MVTRQCEQIHSMLVSRLKWAEWTDKNCIQIRGSLIKSLTLYTRSLCISYSTDNENLFDNQELPSAMIISFILTMTWNNFKQSWSLSFLLKHVSTSPASICWKCKLQSPDTMHACILIIQAFSIDYYFLRVLKSYRSVHFHNHLFNHWIVDIFTPLMTPTKRCFSVKPLINIFTGIPVVAQL